MGTRGGATGVRLGHPVDAGRGRARRFAVRPAPRSHCVSRSGFHSSLGYFVLLTRMHERYVFNALLLAIPLVWYQRRYLIASLGLTLTLFANLCYSLYYLHVMDGKIPDVDPQDLIPWLSHPMALLNFAIFCYAGYIFLGVGDDPLEHIGGATLWQRVANPLRAWFAPL